MQFYKVFNLKTAILWRSVVKSISMDVMSYLKEETVFQIYGFKFSL